MSCEHPRIKVTDEDEVYCWDCFNTVFVGVLPTDLRQPHSKPQPFYDFTSKRGRERAYKLPAKRVKA